MEVNGKRYIRSDSASCAHIVEESSANANKRSQNPHEKLRALLNAPDDDTDELLPTPSDAPKFGTVIHNRIFVGGFSLTTTDEDLWKFFTTFATVTAARVIYDRAGVSKCYGFVTFASPRHARLIVKQSGGVMYSPLGRLRIAQAVRKQINQLAVIPSDCVTAASGVGIPSAVTAGGLATPLCYQLVCAPTPPCTAYAPCTAASGAPCDLQPYALYPIAYDGGPMSLYAPVMQYGPAPQAQLAQICPCDPSAQQPPCCATLEKTPRPHPTSLHHAGYIY